MLEQIIVNLHRRMFSVLRITKVIRAMKENRRYTEAELIEKIENIKTFGTHHQIPSAAYNALKYAVTGNEPDFIMIGFDNSNGSNNLGIDFWYNGNRRIYNSTTDATRKILSEAVHYLKVSHHYPIGFNG